MIDVKPTNMKLEHRARGILRDICGSRCPSADEDLSAILETCNGSVKLAAVVITLKVPVQEAQRLLEEVDGMLALVLKEANSPLPLTIGKRSKASYYLCVDAGGSKCAAVIISKDGIQGTGISGPCNV